MKKLFVKESLASFIIIAGSMLLAFIQCIYVEQELLEISYQQDYVLTRFDFYNFIILAEDFSKYVYLNKENYNLLLQPMSFIFFGLFVCGIDFLMCPSGYLMLKISKLKNEKSILKYINYKNWYYIPLYIISYYAFIYCYGLTLDYKVDTTHNLLLMFGNIVLTHILLFILLKNILLKLHFRFGVTKSVLYAVVMIMLLFCVDFPIVNDTFSVFFFTDRLSYGAWILIIVMLIVNTINFRKIDLLRSK